jgi:hypothetical protein
MPSRLTPNRWSRSDVTRLRKLAGRRTVKQIGKQLKRSEAAVRYKAWSENISLSMR